MNDAMQAGATRYVARHADAPSSTGSTIYNTIYRELGLDAAYLQFSGRDPGGFVGAMKTLGFCGSTVVGSFASAIVPHLDDLDDHARRVGAVNTVTYHDGVALGHKTDGPALIRSIEDVTDLRDRRVVIAGAGHLVREILYLLVAQGVAEISVFNRSEDRASEVVASIGARVGGDLDALAGAEGDILINATPIGSRRCETKRLIPEEAVTRFGLVMDTAFIPSRTPLIVEAEARGVPVVTGLTMFAHQGAAQVHHYFGVVPDLDRLRGLIDAEFNG